MNGFEKQLVLGTAILSAVFALGGGSAYAQSGSQGTATVTTDNKNAGRTMGAAIDDTVVTTKVKSALLADPTVKGSDIKVETNKGVVQLSGFSDNKAQVDRAVTIARGVEGVNDVVNKVSLASGNETLGNKVSDGILTAKVKSALLSDPNVKSSDISVVTRKGEVQLSGFVASQSQIDRAAEVARSVSGVQNVVNELSLKK